MIAARSMTVIALVASAPAMATPLSALVGPPSASWTVAAGIGVDTIPTSAPGLFGPVAAGGDQISVFTNGVGETGTPQTVTYANPPPDTAPNPSATVSVDYGGGTDPTISATASAPTGQYSFPGADQGLTAPARAVSTALLSYQFGVDCPTCLPNSTDTVTIDMASVLSVAVNQLAGTTTLGDGSASAAATISWREATDYPGSGPVIDKLYEYFTYNSGGYVYALDTTDTGAGPVPTVYGLDVSPTGPANTLTNSATLTATVNTVYALDLSIQAYTGLGFQTSASIDPMLSIDPSTIDPSLYTLDVSPAFAVPEAGTMTLVLGAGGALLLAQSRRRPARLSIQA